MGKPLLIHTVSAATGDSRWQLLKAAGLSDGAGRMVAAVTVIEDVSAVKTAEVHMRILSESGRVLASSLDLRETLANVAEVGVPGLADWCVVDLIDEALIREHVAITHRDPDRRELVRQMRGLEPAQIDPGSTEEHLRILQALAIRSAVAVPMRTRGRTAGVMTCCTSESQRRLTKVDLELAEQLAARAAMAVDNSRLHTTLSRVSETLQQEILTDGQDCLALIGDVTGRGVTAATLTALLRHGARFASRVEPEPAAILHRLDEVLRERAGTSLCTALCARIGEGTLVLSSAGHPPALIVDADGTVTETPTPGPLLGAFADATWT
jgi:serine phosphatase RsbU (regulator of sigma subunit)